MASKPTIRLTFHGAAGCVTGSKFLVEVEDKKILVDCGLFQGKKKLRLRNWEKPLFEPSEVSAVVLTHAHIDHTGFLPLIVRRGFNGPVYCTPATEELLKLLLPDSARLQEEEAKFANKHKTSKHNPAKPLYTSKDVSDTLELIRTVERDQWTELFPKIQVRPSCAGHILGSTALTLEAHGRRITFSGDIGRYDTPILPDPCGVDLGDMLLCESTYGDRVHADSDILTELAAVVNRAAERKGPLLIPAFAVGRTQNLLYHLAELEREGRIPTLPVYVDSPMAVDATKIYRSFKHDYDEEASELLRVGETPLLTERTSFCKSVQQSKELNHQRGAFILISASGMINGGRILHHIRNWIDKEECTLLFVGYQAEGTRGRLLQSGAREIKVFGQYHEVRARVETISGLSAHGDRNELSRWLKSCSGNPSITRIIHGEKEASRAFAGHLREEFDWDARPAQYRETVEF